MKNAFSPKRLAKCEVKHNNELIKPFIDFPEEINIKESQQNDEQIKKLKNRLTRSKIKTENLFVCFERFIP